MLCIVIILSNFWNNHFKEELARDRDKAMLPILKQTLVEKRKL